MVALFVAAGATIAFNLVAEAEWDTPRWLQIVIFTCAMGCVGLAGGLRRRGQAEANAASAVGSAPERDLGPLWSEVGVETRRMRVISIALLSAGIASIALMYFGIFEIGWNAQAAIWLGIIGLPVGIAAIPVWEVGNLRHRMRQAARSGAS